MHLISIPLQVMFIVVMLLSVSTHHSDLEIKIVVHRLISRGVVSYFE